MSLSRISAQILRIEQGLYKEFLNCSGVIGEVGQIYQNGFDLIRKDGAIIHFRGEKWLHSPFGVVLDQPVSRWIEQVFLKEGDIFEIKDKLLQRRDKGVCSIKLDPYFIINLKRTLSFHPPESETLIFRIQLLCEEIFKARRFEGMAGLLSLLVKRLPSLNFISLIPISFWSEHALPWVRKLILSVINEDLYEFEFTWEALLGLGPGLTPAADDFLVGFLAVHKLFSSTFGEKISEDDVKTRLEERAKIKTIPTSFQFIKCALGGIFSEILYLAFDDLRTKAENGGREHIKYLLKWGHSSGTDTLTGVVFGLWSLIPSHCELKAFDKNRNSVLTMK